MMQPEEKIRAIRAIVNDGNPALTDALKELFQWRPMGGQYPLAAVADVVTGEGSGYYLGAEKRGGELNEEEFPFFTEGFLYPLLGKEDARGLLALLHEVLLASGLDRHADGQWTDEAYREFADRKRAHAHRERLRQQQQQKEQSK